MSSVLPASVSRVSQFLASQVTLANLGRTNLSLFDVQNQISSGNAITRASDDSVSASAISILIDRLSAQNQQKKSMAHASTVLNALDSSLGDATDIVRQAQTIASSQIGVNSDPTTRAQQAVVVESLMRQLLTISNRSVSGVYYFGGSVPNTPPVESFNGGIRYNARGTGMLTDLGTGDSIPITIGGNNAIGEVSARQRSTLDLNPGPSGSTQLADIFGAAGRGFTPGVVQFSFNGGPVAQVDLTQAKSVQDVVAAVSSAIRQYETANSVTILDLGAVSIGTQGITFDVVAGGTLTFTDQTNATTGADLGLTQAAFTPVNNQGADLNSKLTLGTSLSQIPGLTLPLGTIRLRLNNGAQSVVRDVNLSSAQRIDDVRNLIESSGIGARVQIGSNGRGLDIFNEVAGLNLSVEEVGGGTSATQLGLRTLTATTSTMDFNQGRGVKIVDNVTNPLTGALDPSRNTDFRVTLGNGQWFDVDLRPADMATVSTVLARINAQFAAAVGTQNNPAAPALAAGDFTAGLVNGPNGLALGQAVGPGAIVVTGLNNSGAAEDLGLSNLTFDAVSARYIGQDRANLRVDNLFSDLIDLRQALLANDSTGITLAGQRLTASADRLSAAQALVGAYSARVKQADEDLADRIVLDTKMRSELQEVDFAAAASRFSQLQTQLEAGLRTANVLGSRSLFDFLG